MEGLLALVIFLADIWAILSIIGSGASTGSKILWALLVLIMPVLGLIIWYFAGPKK